MAIITGFGGKFSLLWNKQHLSRGGGLGQGCGGVFLVPGKVCLIGLHVLIECLLVRLTSGC